MADQDNGDATLPPGPQGVSTDASNKATLGKMWDSWTSHPENNAAMINFGLQLMQPLGPGESQLGHFGRAIGAAGEASTANVEAQRKQEALEEQQEQAQEGLNIKEREAGAYEKIAEQRAQGKTPSAFNQRMKDQAAENRDFYEWLTGKGGKYTTEDNLWQAMQSKYPTLKSKADLMNQSGTEPYNYARQLFHRFHQSGGDQGDSSGGTPQTVVQNGMTYVLGPDGRYH